MHAKKLSIGNARIAMASPITTTLCTYLKPKKIYDEKLFKSRDLFGRLRTCGQNLFQLN